MRYLKLFESFEKYEIHKICKKYNIIDYTINTDGSIDVNGHVYLSNYKNRSNKKLKELPLKFNKVYGGFDCSNNYLTSLEGSPVEVDYIKGTNVFFACDYNKLTSFKGSPKTISGNFSCEGNKINSFEHFPRYVSRFFCDGNPIFQVWRLFEDTTKIELLNDFDIFRDEDTDNPSIVMDRLNDFLLTIGKKPVTKINRYKNI